MPGLTLANALKDFGAGPSRPAEPFYAAPAPLSATTFPDASPAAAASDLHDFPLQPAMESVDVDALVAEAVAEAERALCERLAQDHAEALHAEQERHAEEIVELQRRFADEAGDRILAAFTEMEGRLVESTAAVAARVLGGVLTDDLRERSIDRLAGHIREALCDGEAVRIRVHGSLPLFETLKEKLPERASQLDFMESPQFDLSVAIDDSIYETRLAEWSAALAETLA